MLVSHSSASGLKRVFNVRGSLHGDARMEELHAHLAVIHRRSERRENVRLYIIVTMFRHEICLIHVLHTHFWCYVCPLSGEV